MILVDDLADLGFENAVAAGSEWKVQDPKELQDLVFGYQTQNAFLNKEIVELHQILHANDVREQNLTKYEKHENFNYRISISERFYNMNISRI